jgi:cytochrome c biogenesis protein CcmG, thiol:disulfide interchange protein DsbE
MKKFLPFLVLVFLMGLIGFSTFNLSQKESTTEQENIGESNPQDSGMHFVKTNISLPEFSLPDLFNEEAEFSKKDLVGKFSVINFFASWCTTCRAEHEILLALKSKKIVDIYGVAWHDIDENTKSFLEKDGNPYMKVAKDSRGLFTKMIGLEAVPETVIVDKRGHVVMRFKGNLQEFSIEEIEEFLRRNN